MPSITLTAASESATLHRLGGPPAAPPVLLLHANGFAGALYRPLVDAGLGAAHAVWALDAPGQGRSAGRARHGQPGALAAYPALALKAAAWIKKEGNGGDVLFAFGHSGGGLAAVLAALERPGVFTALYLYEPVLLPRPALSSTPDLVAGARRRKRFFASRAAAAAALASKPPMAAFHPAVLQAYVDVCLVEDDEHGVRLAASPEDEAAVYLEAAELGARAWKGLPKLRGGRGASASTSGATTDVRKGGGDTTTLPLRITIAGSGDGGPLARAAPRAAVEAGATFELHAALTHLGPFEAPAEIAAAAVAAFGGMGGRSML